MEIIGCLSNRSSLFVVQIQHKTGKFQLGEIILFDTWVDPFTIAASELNTCSWPCAPSIFCDMGKYVNSLESTAADVCVLRPKFLSSRFGVREFTHL